MSQTIRRLEGTEKFHVSGEPLTFDVLDFWRWSASDLTSNVVRGRLAEYIVARALDIPLDCRIEWDACDLRLPNGVTIEVKSAAYVQAWHQTKPSRITFGIQPTYAWDSKTNTFDTAQRRFADIYVFCLLYHPDAATLDPVDMAQWKFYVLPTNVLDTHCKNQKTISLTSLCGLKPRECSLDSLASAINELASKDFGA